MKSESFRSRYTTVSRRSSCCTWRTTVEQTRIYSRETGLFSRVDPNLETEVRREAERQLRESFLADGILETAEQNARQTLTRFLEGFGFEQITIE